MNNETLVEVLRSGARITEGLSRSYGGNVGALFGVSSVALDAAAALAADGDDPVVGIKRILGADRGLADVRSRWDDALDAKFGPRGA